MDFDIQQELRDMRREHREDLRQIQDSIHGGFKAVEAYSPSRQCVAGDLNRGSRTEPGSSRLRGYEREARPDGEYP